MVQGRPNSHSELWQEFTDDVIRYIAERNKQEDIRKLDAKCFKEPFILKWRAKP